MIKCRKIICMYSLVICVCFAACGNRTEPEKIPGQTDTLGEVVFESQVTAVPQASEVPKATQEPTQTPQPTVIPEPTPTPEPTATPEPPTIRLVMVGDMLMHERVMESGLQEDGSYNFDHLFVHVQEQIEAADLALVNQETILGGIEIGLTGYPCFNSPYELGVAEVEAGFDVILHGTNHALDKGKRGATNCMDFWEETYPDIAYLGINRSQEAQDSDIYVYEQDGMRIAILNYTYGTNGISTPEGMPYLVNYMDEDKILADLKLAEEQADFTIVCPHWGKEYYLGISSSQKKWTKLFLENGVDLVLGTHPHVIEPVEWVQDENGHEMLVYYSLGNFVNGTSGIGEGVMNRCVGGLADVTIGRDESGEVAILEYAAIPLVCHIDEGEAYTVWYLEDYTEELAQENHIVSQDGAFSLENCKALVEEVWGGFHVEVE
ncbi:MAG: CapA family protein [Lachnospiraceae bacterium]|nr:CapA family protein [Lachnospiraceae bacterium]